MFLKKLFRRNPLKPIADKLYDQIVAQARKPVFYLETDVPDTVDGRFEMVSLHCFLVLRRLKREGENGQELAQTLFDRMFADMDHSLREIGVGDLSVGKRIKAMAQVFYGRIVAYGEALDGESEETLEMALARNHYGTLDEPPSEEKLRRMAVYVRENDALLAGQSYTALSTGDVRFLDLAETDATMRAEPR
ncbi:ubiquinol-cytochrome C chaperone family protein [Sneathiella glossodoripedis]|uniref:ubiquinol-cytochrome C chaperone family protein n=1 Tax=Sneathiella glossodoripedis TaxID=418853 RepID=UPI000471777C|nr:ubiquinol-cytochrome C chaperone family protein [Sneathiella glossodoripedis]